jgi:hypothetical protein
MMATQYKEATRDFLDTLEVILDGERLFTAQARSKADRFLCALICGGTRLGGVLLLVVALMMNARGDTFGAFYVAVFGLTLFFGSLVGMREYQNTPARIELDDKALRYTDPWTGRQRVFPRNSCLNVRCARSAGECSIYVVHPDNGMDLLVDGLPREVLPELVQSLNAHLCVQVNENADDLPCVSDKAGTAAV